MKAYECLEDGCTFVAKAETEEELIEQVQEHMGSVHDSFEVEEFILTGAYELSANSK
ncbi:DUF1059 domain-containing protein [Siminovitchia sediminis]|uniref:DUF1059 domain-containing protein n=1 Tax=Siminovitchia sediminis TaxID=1274353 RepID=A0ABW4KBQ3_9BACI